MGTAATRLRLTSARASLRRRVLRLGVLSLAILLLASGCTGDEASPEAPAPPAAATVEAPGPTVAAATATPAWRPGPTATPWVAGTPAPPPTSAPVAETFEFTIQLVDLSTGEVRELFTSPDRTLSPLAEFAPGGEGVWVHDRERRETRVFSLDGTHESTISWDAAGSPLGGRCRRTAVDGVVEIDGQRFAVNCGLFSPQGDLMAYTVRAEAARASGQPFIYEQWLLTLDTGERTQLRDDLQHCGGCDFRAGPQWSPSGRYFMFVELSAGSRTWVTDVQTGTTRLVASGRGPAGRSVGEFGRNPTWSPIDDTLLLPAPGGGTIVEHLPSGTVREFATLRWPSSFSDDGTYIISPRPGTVRGAVTTILVDAASGDIVARLSGAPASELLWIDRRIIVSQEEVPAVLLEGGGCSGATRLHHPLAGSDRYCIDGATGAVFSPTADRVAFARVTGRTGLIEGPGFSSVGSNRYEIGVLDIAFGEERIVLAGLIGLRDAPVIRWNDAGTHLLVVWPVGFGE